MKLQALDFLRCPACRGSLEIAGVARQTKLKESELKCASCHRSWPVRDGIPHLVFPEELQGADLRSRRLWDRMAPFWGALLTATNVMRGTRGPEEQHQLIERLELRPGHSVLETAAGAGRNLQLIAQQMGDQVSVFGLDLSSRMLDRASKTLRHLPRPPQLVLGNSTVLPFADGVFDALLDGFGIKYYSDKRRAIGEMLRVVKPGGKVVISELGLPAGKRRTLRQRLLLLWIPGFSDPPPIDLVPPEVDRLNLSWDAYETVYTIEFRKPTSAGPKSHHA